MGYEKYVSSLLISKSQQVCKITKVRSGSLNSTTDIFEKLLQSLNNALAKRWSWCQLSYIEIGGGEEEGDLQEICHKCHNTVKQKICMFKKLVISWKTWL